MMYGVLETTGELLGLGLIPGYRWQWLRLWSRDFGSPQARGRMYLVMAREDVCGEDAFARCADAIERVPPRCHAGSAQISASIVAADVDIAMGADASSCFLCSGLNSRQRELLKVFKACGPAAAAAAATV